MAEATPSTPSANDDLDLGAVELWPREAQSVLTLELCRLFPHRSLAPTLQLTQQSTDDAAWGLHSSVWSGGLALLSYLGHHGHEMFSSSAVLLELGAGTGVVGIGAASLHLATRVVVTDLPAALPLLQGNAELCDEPVEVRALVWGTPLARLLAELGIDAETELVVLGSDIVYKPTLFEPLLDSIMELLQGAARARAILATQFRGEAQQIFWRGAAGRGLEVQLLATLEVPSGEATGVPRLLEESEDPSVAPTDLDIVDVYVLRPPTMA